MIKIILTLLIFINLSFAAYEKVQVGRIDREYQNKITPKELKKIILEIEKTFERQLGFNVFDYSDTGKFIHIVYMPPSSMEKKIKRRISWAKQKRQKQKQLESFFPKQQKKIDNLKEKVSQKNSLVNEKIEAFNNYVRELNKNPNVTREEYNQIQKEVKKRKRALNKEINLVEREKRALNRQLNIYNQKVFSYNNISRDINRINNEIESMSRRYKVVKGRAFGTQETTLKTFYKDGKRVREKTVTNTMDKIEIYGFDSIKELKAVLAHEIAHLVGVPHIGSRNALMNPLLQKNQIRKLELTREDIINFKEHF